jgi:hypothetical protein
MGRSKELSPEERADLVRRGYRSIEVWIPDTTAYRAEAERQARSAVEADRAAGLEQLSDEDPGTDWCKL